jgi:GMP synthase (glutamine-hydrolysing)
MRQVFLLQHNDVEKPGLIADVMASAGYSVRSLFAAQGQPVPQNIEDAQGLVIMGGPMGVYETDLHPYLRDELRLIEKALEKSKPILGVCLGSQLLAAALGSEVRKGKRKEIGWYSVTPTKEAEDDPLLAGINRAFLALHWHGDVFDLPHRAVRLASSALTTCQAFCYQESAYGFLFHMEAGQEIVEGMTRAFKDELSQAGIDGEEIARAASGHLPELRRIGRLVFERWSSLLSKAELSAPGRTPEQKGPP